MSTISKSELKALYESGAKLTKIRQKKVNAELKRKCKVPGCSESLAFMNANANFCPGHRASGISKLRTYNRRKKARFDAKHGTGRKTIKRNVTVNDKYGVKYDPTITLLYEDYKEPLKTVEDALGKGKGFGYMGTVALTEDRKLVQCHICGNLYPSVGIHLRAHKIKAKDYKSLFGLQQKTALIGEEVRKKQQERVIKVGLKGKGLPKHLEGFNEKWKSGELKRKKQGDYSLEWRNKKGLCPDQVLERILELKEKLGRVPSSDEFRAEYKGRYMASILYQHGSWVNAVNKLGLQSREELRTHSKDELITELREFYEKFERIPMTSDFNRGLLTNRGTYIRKFGSLNNARIEAGMNAILAMPFGQIVELTPDEYIRYTEGHKIDKVSEKAHKKRLYRRNKRLKLRQLKEAI